MKSLALIGFKNPMTLKSHFGDGPEYEHHKSIFVLKNCGTDLISVGSQLLFPQCSIATNDVELELKPHGREGVLHIWSVPFVKAE
jgi:hypothetical protein